MNLRAVLKSGDPFIWLTAGSLAVSLLMIVALVVLVSTRALGFFWPGDLVRLKLADGAEVLGLVRGRELRPHGPGGASPGHRVQLQVGNRDLFSADFRWIDEAEIRTADFPPDAVLLERREWGNFFGYLKEVRRGEQVVAAGAEESWRALLARLDDAQRLAADIRSIERGEMGDINYEIERDRLELKALDAAGAGAEARARVIARIERNEARHAELQEKLADLHERSRGDRVVLVASGGREKELPLVQIVRALRPNRMTAMQKAGVYLSRLWEFVSDDPRESNTEGGIFPAIFGTVLMVLLMSIAVVPFGVLAALYLREYARQGVLVRTVRIAVNNLAGVPSIVFGVFGLGFFVYFLGGSIDALFFPERLPAPTFGTGGILWASLTLALLTVPVVVVATEEALAAVPRENREGSLALGATRFETVWRVVLPNALPGILTGLILAMARGAGEVAPLMITGVVKLAPSLPVDGHWPFLHLDRKFMHLGFHIYDVGFQSPNVEAAKPMVYLTTLLLVGIIITLNLAAILIRNRLRRRFAGSTF